ncbi:chemotaxis protein CheW [Teredinibacter turnerae]|uniref:chemotaxis protein CheW n=1 Tax=Teredinibacter turnerae TaxID=2426 RepID=UPI0030CC26D0
MSKQTFGVVSLGRYHLGIELRLLREVVERENEFNLPGHSEWVVGGIHLRGENIPLVDLAPMLGGVSAEEESALYCAAIVDVGDKTVGIVCQNPEGVITVDAKDIAEMHHTSVPKQVIRRGVHFNSVSLNANSASTDLSSQFICLLDVERLLAVDGITSVRSSKRKIESGLNLLSNLDAQHALLFQIGSIPCAMGTEPVVTLLDKPIIQDVSYRSDILIGEVILDGLAVPCINTAKLINLRADVAQCRQLVVLKIGNGMVGLLVSDIFDVVYCSPGERSVPINIAGLQVEYFHSLLPIKAIQGVENQDIHGIREYFFYLDVMELCASEKIHSIAKSTHKVTGAEAAVEQRDLTLDYTYSREHQSLRFRARREVLAVLSSIAEILYLKDCDVMFLDATHLRAIMLFRNESVPILYLGALLQESEDDDLSKTHANGLASEVILLVRCDSGYFGFAIDEMISIDNIEWTKDSSPMLVKEVLASAFYETPMAECWRITKTVQGQKKYYHSLDLCKLANLLVHGDTPWFEAQFN